jgi:hypothetical protein
MKRELIKFGLAALAFPKRDEVLRDAELWLRKPPEFIH